MAWHDKIVEGMGLDIPEDLRKSVRCFVRIEYGGSPAAAHLHYSHHLTIFLAIPRRTRGFRFYEVCFSLFVYKDPHNITRPPISIEVKEHEKDMFLCCVERETAFKGITAESWASMGQAADPIKLTGEIGHQQLDLHATLWNFYFFVGFLLELRVPTGIVGVSAKDRPVLEEAAKRIYSQSEDLFEKWITAACKRREQQKSQQRKGARHARVTTSTGRSGSTRARG